VKVGVVGAGFMGSVHLAAYAGMPGVEVVGVADANGEAAVSGAAAAGARPYPSYEALVSAEDVDVIDACVPTALHGDLALRVAADGKHLFLEKPIARTLEEADEILSAFEASEGRLLVGHVVRFFPEYARIKAMVEAGDVGTVGVARTSRRSPFLRGWNDWYADWRQSGGVLVDLVIHDFDFLRWCFGEVERVYAGGVMGREYNRLDYALTTLRFAGGPIAHVEGHWGFPAPFEYAIEVAGSKGLVTANSTEAAPLKLLQDAGSAGEAPGVAVGTSPYQAELEHFVRCVERGEEPVVDGKDAREALRVSLAAIESIRTGEAVTIGGRA
jgi:predicted dehydrogenase